MRLPNEAHTAQPWRIRDIASDFRLEDVWELPGDFAAADFPRLVDALASFDPSRISSAPVRALFAIRMQLGKVLGWDADRSPTVSRPNLRDRLPADLRDGPRGPDIGGGAFTALYMTDDEWAAETANRTMHGVIHLGLVPVADDAGSRTDRYRAHLAILVKPNGLLGEVYMAAIKPFRHLLVYPTLMREGERQWRELSSTGA